MQLNQERQQFVCPEEDVADSRVVIRHFWYNFYRETYVIGIPKLKK